MNLTTCNFEIGDIYLFTGHGDKCLWGIFSHHDQTERIVLETSTSDFEVFQQNTIVPDCFTVVQPASRCDLRDFAYNMGLQRI